MEHGENSLETVIIDQMRIQRRYGYRFVKRGFDILASLMGLILLSPLFLIVAIAIKVDDPRGKVFYSQIRLGRGERPFKMFKFRSMFVDADKKLADLLKYNEVDGAMFKMKEDPRVTRIGHFIRKYSIDELPQLINVLKGDMSLVGPRPPLEREVANYSEYAKQRLYVKPGCTGLWQVSGRNSVGFDEMVELDLQYIEKSSFWFDLKIMFLTVKIMIWPNSAY
ncbi:MULTISPECIES: sugar transferase [Lactiplantibacillus]|uniref:sugar transferase n=1 Tax=Lactiplantibacillus TaxID=2767842 RepID=UPI000F0278F6|nr:MULTISPECIES: sugar transferase [Lactiplantibacillus]MBU7478707.1 sugar transferase [Lactiplantibacillus pentosus]MBU7536514.1 sugar transferase [Lactiplantibacillus pentosus]MDN7016962.1 sugar transferase [Lactiplantibacillus plantarum]MDN7050962.1 sugar transferase [Lactiplantibacillus plantarum]MDN7053982.1 sugar transferase [Lactiplantibacillus plantarum]